MPAAKKAADFAALDGPALRDLAAYGTATGWATTGLFAADAVRSLGAFHFNVIRQLFGTLLLALMVLATGGFNQPDSITLQTLAISGL
ncbi:hypothetical protein [Cypionkella sp.]|uniref:hypothetical protein n=1 Tax=Cypionkella sp. TaxID=2811411 RepID=UPI0026255648|nr:hypothetical protein [Cypionkella sp.]